MLNRETGMGPGRGGEGPGRGHIPGGQGTGGNAPVNLALLFSTVFFVFLNFASSITVIPLYVLELGGTEFISGLQGTLFLVTAVILRLYFGPLADSRGRKLPIVLGTLAFALAPVLFWWSRSVGMVITARLVQAVGPAAFFSSASSLVGDLAPADRRGAYISYHRILVSLALLVGPAGTLYLINNWGYPAWFAASTAAGLAGFFLSLGLEAPYRGEGESPGSLERVKALARDKKLLIILGGMASTGACLGVLLTFVIIYISRVTPLENPGFYFTTYALSSILTNLLAGRLSDRWGRAVIFWPGVFLLGSGVGLLYFLPRFPAAALPSSLLTGMGAAGSISMGLAWVIDTVGEKVRATALALVENILDLSIASSALVFGLAAHWPGMPISFGLTGLNMVLAGAAAYYLGKKKGYI